MPLRVVQAITPVGMSDAVRSTTSVHGAATRGGNETSLLRVRWLRASGRTPTIAHRLGWQRHGAELERDRSENQRPRALEQKTTRARDAALGPLGRHGYACGRYSVEERIDRRRLRLRDVVSDIADTRIAAARRAEAPSSSTPTSVV